MPADEGDDSKQPCDTMWLERATHGNAKNKNTHTE